MSDISIAQAVEAFTHVTQGASAADLERPWVWGAYDEEGVRFAFFRTYEELRELAVRLLTARVAAGSPPTAGQRILALYHLAQRDLEAALLGVSPALATRPPAPGEWSVHQALAHMAQATIGFYAVVRYTLDSRRDGIEQPPEMTDETWEAAVGASDAALLAQLGGEFADLLAFAAQWHDRVLAEFADVTEEELAWPSRYWEGYDLPLRFRLHRFDAHLRQHTIQVDKTLLALGHAPTEARRLLRLIYAALAEVEGALIGAAGVGDALVRHAAASIAARSEEIAVILKSSGD
ncbi:DinB family protein [Candidatus Amarolinea aalborgensis]|uniref:DinB family protein n=1 Tax=Candidatus Amarolinea aalborgensis TaxID=2249329 RepID=UPI003BFA0826